MTARQWVWEVTGPEAQVVETLHSRLVGVRTVKSISRTSDHTIDVTTSRIPGWAIFLSVILTPLWLLARSNGTFRIRTEQAGPPGCRVSLAGAMTRPMARQLTAVYHELNPTGAGGEPAPAASDRASRVGLLDRVVIAAGALAVISFFLPTGARAEGRAFLGIGVLLAIAAAGIALVGRLRPRALPDSARVFAKVALRIGLVVLIVAYFDIGFINHTFPGIGYWLALVATAAGATASSIVVRDTGRRVPGAV